MKIFLRILGRILFCLMLITSGYNKIYHANLYVYSFEEGYQQIRNIHLTLKTLPSINDVKKQIPTNQIIQIVGLMEIITSVLILIGESLGIVLFFVWSFAYLISHNLPVFLLLVKTRNHSFSPNDFRQIIPHISLIGIGVAFLARQYLIGTQKQQKNN